LSTPIADLREGGLCRAEGSWYDFSPFQGRVSMAEQTRFPTLADRAKVLLVNIAVFYAALVLASGYWLPTGGLEGVWFLSALALWFLSLLSAPWFIPSRDALANAIGASVILVTAELAGTTKFHSQLELIRWVGVAYCVGVALLSLASLFLHDRDFQSPWGKLCFRLTGIFGPGEVLYTFPALISIIGAYQQSLPSVGWLLILWTTFIIARPAERALAAWHYWAADVLARHELPAVGTIERIDHPNIVRVRLIRSDGWKPGALHIAAMPDGDQQFVLALFMQVQGVEVMGTGLCVAGVAERIEAIKGHVHIAPKPAMAAEFVENLSGTKGAEMVGFTVENSTIGTLRFEVGAAADLAEGDVIFTKTGGSEVFYQILDVETAEESFDQNPRGTHIVKTAQLGCYDPGRGFTKYPWLPAMNTPLFMAKGREFPQVQVSEREFLIGDVPSTKIGVVANIDDLVEYHTAILGVTGTGKTELALDVVREALTRGVKVFCVDFTGEYRARLDDLKPIFPAPPAEVATDLEAKLFAAETGAYGAGAEKKALSAALKGMHATIEPQIAEFLAGKNNLAIFELADIANTKASLRLTEMYLSAIMSWARKNRKARQIMIVLEEAHTIIPETHGAGFDYDTQWVVSRIGQIALQGRKYGVGLLVVSQRTALVSKTILSQCNTFLTHSLIDQTSLNFLDSVYSSQHVRLIPNLRFLEFLAFGKALRAERPILLKRAHDPVKKRASEKLRRPLKQPAPSAYEDTAADAPPVAPTAAP
jgi:uncharacterized protein